MTLAIVTGTTSGIGLHTAIQLAQQGVTVIATVRDTARADSLRSAASEAGVDLDVRALDVTDAEAARALVEAAGPVDILVNNAGRGAVGTLEQLSDQDLQDQLETNYLSVARLTRLVLPGMRERGSGRIVTVTSVGGAVGQPFADAYCGAKFAVEGLMQSLAPVVAPFGIDVAIVEPAGSPRRSPTRCTAPPPARTRCSSRPTSTARRPRSRRRSRRKMPRRRSSKPQRPPLLASAGRRRTPRSASRGSRSPISTARACSA